MNALNPSQSRIQDFQEHFQNLGQGNRPYWLLCLSAFPLAVTPDLLYRLWQNFRELFPDEAPIERVSVADVLLWSAWRETAPEVFELDEDIRHELLLQLRQLNDQSIEQQQQRMPAKPISDLMQALAQFLYQYTTQADSPSAGSLLESAQRLGVQAMLAPGKAMEEVVRELEQHKDNAAEMLRIRNLVGALASMHPTFEPLHSLANRIRTFHLGGGSQTESIQVGEVNQNGKGPLVGLTFDTKLTKTDSYIEVALPTGMAMDLPEWEGKQQEPPKQLFLLSVGIDNYEKASLHGCVNDANLLAEVLPNYFKTENGQVHKCTLLNEQATKPAILDVLKTNLNQAGPNDMVVFTFAGHGDNAKQKATQNAIFAFDFSRDSKEPEAKSATTITETEFRELVRLEGKHNPHILLITDTHNGSPNWLDPENPKHIILTAGSDWDVVQESQHEGQQHGALTAALVSALRSTRARAPQTYHSLIRKIYGAMQRDNQKQTPQLFGKIRALKNPFLGKDDFLELYTKEFIGKLTTSGKEPNQLDESFDLKQLTDKALERYAGINEVNSLFVFYENVALLEKANLVANTEQDLLALCIGDDMVRQKSEYLASLLSFPLGKAMSFYDSKIVFFNTPKGTEYSIKAFAQDHQVFFFFLNKEVVGRDNFQRIADHLAHQARFENRLVFPILCQPCEWENSSLKHIPVYPLNNTPISQWESEDAGWRIVAEEIYAVLKPYSSFYPETDRAKALRSIGKVSSGVNQTYVSGFLVAPDLLLTSSLLIDSEAKAKEGFITFTDAGRLSATFQLQPDRFFLIDNQTNTVLVSLAETPIHSDYRNPRTSVDYFTLKLTSDPVKTGDILDATHFDRVQRLFPNIQTVLFADDNHIQFSGQGVPGTAGGPLLNEQLEAVAVNPASREMFPNNPNQQEGKGTAPTINALLQRIMDEESEGTWAFEDGKIIRPGLSDNQGNIFQFKRLVFNPTRVFLHFTNEQIATELAKKIQQESSSLQIVREESKAEYVLQKTNELFYITYPTTSKEPKQAFRPLIAPVRKYRIEADELLLSDLKHIAYWEYLKKFTNPSSLNKLPNEPLHIEIWDTMTGLDQQLPVEKGNITLNYHQRNDKWKAKIRISITNETQQSLYIGVLFLSDLFGSFTEFLDSTFLEPGKKLFLGLRGKDEISGSLGETEILYNWPYREEYIKFMISTQPFDIESLKLEALKGAIISSDDGDMRGEKYMRGLSIEKNYTLAITDWITQSLTLHWINPLYNKVPTETMKAMLHDSDLSYFAQGLYPDFLQSPPVSSPPPNSD